MDVLQKDNLFFIEVNRKKIAYIEFRLEDNTLYILHTIVDEFYQGQGLAKKLTEKAISYSKKNNYKIKPICSYAVNYFKEHQEYKELLK